MDEFLFGTLSTDQLRLMHHRTSLRGLHHLHNVHPRDPLPGEAITLKATVGPDTAADHVACYYTVDGSQPLGSKGIAQNGQVAMFEVQDTQWDTMVWGYVVHWVAVLPPQPEGTTIRYQIGAWAGDAPEIFADWPSVKATAEQVTGAYFRGEGVDETLMIGDPHKPHTFTLSVDRFTSPQWAREAIIYHIFVDRFYPGEGRTWLQTDDLNGFCGGTLWGVAEKMDYIVELGANTIWLSPVFISPTHHGYDATDYFHVEPRLGGDEALKHVIETAHARGLRVILDIALNHISDQHPYFQSALKDVNSPYRDWFTFDDSPLGYWAFFGVASMPQVKVTNPDARQWLIDVGLHWLREYQVDGFRLDVADGPGVDFWTDFWRACKQHNPDTFCFGEVVDAPDTQQEYIGHLDGLLDFHTCQAFRRTFAVGQWSEADFDRFVVRHQSAFPKDFLMLTFIDNHDISRFLLVSNGDKESLRRAAAAHLRLPNPPVIYYGTEIGLTQPKLEGGGLGIHMNRVPMKWGDEQDKDLLAFYKGLIAERTASKPYLNH